MSLVMNYDTNLIDRYFSHLLLGDIRDQCYWREVYGGHDYPCWFYLYLACASRLYQSDVVEIGADTGASALCMASETSGKVFSVDIREDAWEYVPDDVENIVKIVSDSTDPEWVKNHDLSKVKLWLIDGLHESPKVRQECELLRPFWTDGSLVVFDDLKMVDPAFADQEGDKFTPVDIHGNGIGLLLI